MWTLLLSGSLALADPSGSGRDFNVPIFLSAQEGGWSMKVIGESGVQMQTPTAAMALLERNLRRCPAVNTLVVQPQATTPWFDTAQMLIGARNHVDKIWIQGPIHLTGTVGQGAVLTNQRLRRAPRSAALVEINSDGVLVDGSSVCSLDPENGPCADSFRPLRAQVGGRPVALFAPPQAPTGMVLHLVRALGDHEVQFGVLRSGDRAHKPLVFDAELLISMTPWVSVACQAPLEP